MESRIYYYIIDLDDGRNFQAHVEDEYGIEIWVCENIEELDGIITDGYMSDKDDIEGLWALLFDENKILLKSELVRG